MFLYMYTVEESTAYSSNVHSPGTDPTERGKKSKGSERERKANRKKERKKEYKSRTCPVSSTSVFGTEVFTSTVRVQLEEGVHLKTYQRKMETVALLLCL
uniref:Uncharacterized protein n=1 Tax=Anguilla anguilla TaxID=7936 RepID=A0A0E9X477_ANGAN